MRHPSEQDLALHAGRDLGILAAWRVGRHVAHCGQCRASVEAYAAFGPDSPKWSELPPDLDWDRLAMEMKANIRLGLEAGECVGPAPAIAGAFSGAHTLFAYAGVIVLVVAGLVLQRPAPMIASHENASHENASPENSVVFAMSGNGIEMKQGGRAVGLRSGRAIDITYSASAQGAVGARYVDADTGYVTIINVNAQ
ncbi:MAG: hypothetical protein ABIZ80_07675 [Bryobacteraceae bacterium]